MYLEVAFYQTFYPELYQSSIIPIQSLDVHGPFASFTRPIR